MSLHSLASLPFPSLSFPALFAAGGAADAPRLLAVDWFVVAAYFVLLVGIVWWSAQKQKSAADYFLAGRHAGWFVVGCSILASNIGSEHIVGLAGSGAANGMAQAHWEMHSWAPLLLAWVFVPFYYSSGVFTMPEFLERRFDGRSRWVLSIVSLVAYVFTKVSVTVYAGAIVFQNLLPDTFGSPENAFWVGAVTTVLLTGVYTVFGGLRAVIYTEVAQTLILLVGSVCVTFFGLSKIGGWGALVDALRNAKETVAAAPVAVQNATGGAVPDFSLWRSLSDVNFPWLGVMMASLVIGVWYWCTDQYIVQRTLAARSVSTARRGAIWGAALKILPVFIFLVPGMLGWVLYQKGILALPVADGKIKGDAVFPALVSTLLPVGLRGLVVAGLLSALMSSLASLFNSCATLFTVDVYAKLNPNRPQAELVRVGRMATLVVVAFGLIWIPVMKIVSEQSAGLYDYLQNFQGFLAPPIFAVFVLGVLSKRVNARGAFAGMLVGFAAGMTKLTLQTLVKSGAIGGDGFFGAIGSYNGYYACGWLTLLSIAVVVGVSLTAPAPAAARLENLTLRTISADKRAEWRAGISWKDIAATGGVIAALLATYLYFSFWI
ncbi:MAG: sodium:solute symporter [Puniceicoccales bacterium]|jgi:SSS family solute:Na+ symporter|nr:sodium:solute symporter [Puniceicoccales bacterium]